VGNTVAAVDDPYAVPSPERIEVVDARRRPASGARSPGGDGTNDWDADVAKRAVGVEALEHELARARSEVTQLSQSLRTEQPARRSAEQRAHAECAQGLDLTRQLNGRARDADWTRQVRGELAAAEARAREVETDLIAARRRIDEAERIAAAAASAREPAQAQTAAVADRPVGERPVGDGPVRDGRVGSRPEPQSAETSRPAQSAQLGRLLDLERKLIVRRAQDAERLGTEPAVTRNPEPAGHGGTGEPVPDASKRPVAALRAELALRIQVEAELRARTVESEARLAARELLGRRIDSKLAQLRDELDWLRSALGREGQSRREAESRALVLERELEGQRRRAHDARRAIAELRRTLEPLLLGHGTMPDPAREAQVNGEVEAQDGAGCDVRLSDALVRLRATVAPLDGQDGQFDRHPGAGLADVGGGRAWLRDLIRALARSDPARAGRLIVELLPAQAVVDPTPVVYDLVLGGAHGCVRVTVRDSHCQVGFGSEPRARNEVDFQVLGDYAALGRFLIASWLRRRFGRGVARVRGDRKRLTSLQALVGVGVGLRAMHEAGVRLTPPTALSVVGGLIVPAWTVGSRFTLAYRSPGAQTAYLVVADGSPVRVAEFDPGGPVATTISGPPGSLELLLAGQGRDDADVSGDPSAVELLHGWLDRARSG
jgi:hypothetical protein